MSFSALPRLVIFHMLEAPLLPFVCLQKTYLCLAFSLFSLTLSPLYICMWDHKPQATTDRYDNATSVLRAHRSIGASCQRKTEPLDKNGL